MNVITFTRYELSRALRNHFTLLFSFLLPSFLLLVIGSNSTLKNTPFRDGNITAYIMIGMALYGAVVTSTSQAASAAVELSHGWGRQLRMTALKPLQFVLVKVFLCVTLSVLPVIAVYIVGGLIGARMPLSQWILTAVLSWILSIVFSLYGLAAGLLFNSETAVGLASASLVIWAFLGNLFNPLSGFMLDIGRFTPLYGIHSLSSYPLTRGDIPTSNPILQDPLWALLLNVAAWTFVFGSICVLAYRKRAGQR